MRDRKAQMEQTLKDLIISALKKAAGEKVIEIKNIPEFYIEVPQERAHGDFASNIAMLTAREAGMPPRKIGEIVAERIETTGTCIEKIEVAGPGFINFYLKPTWANEVIFDILKQGDDFGRQDTGKIGRAHV